MGNIKDSMKERLDYTPNEESPFFIKSEYNFKDSFPGFRPEGFISPMNNILLNRKDDSFFDPDMVKEVNRIFPDVDRDERFLILAEMSFKKYGSMDKLVFSKENSQNRRFLFALFRMF